MFFTLSQSSEEKFEPIVKQIGGLVGPRFNLKVGKNPEKYKVRINLLPEILIQE